MWIEIIGRFGLDGKKPDGPTDPPPGKARVKPELLWVEEEEKLSFSLASYDPDKEIPPTQVVVVLLPSGSDVGTSPDELYHADGVPKGITTVPAWTAGIPETTVPIPDRDLSLSYSGFVLAAWPE